MRYSLILPVLMTASILTPAGLQAAEDKAAAKNKPKSAPAKAGAAVDPHAGHDHAPGEGHEGEEEDPKNESLVDYFWRKSDVAFHAGDYDRAIGLHKAIVILAPDEVDSYGLGAWLLWSKGKSQEALAFLDQGLKANPKDPDMWDTAGQQYDLQKKSADSQKAYKTALDLSGKEASLMLRRRYAHSSEKAGDLTSSLVAWQGLVKDFPADQVNKNNLARVEKVIKDGPAGTPAPALAAGMAAATLLIPTLRRRRVS